MSLLATEKFPGISNTIDRLPELKAWLTDLVFPYKCGGCGRVDFQFCQVCSEELANLPVDSLRRQVEYVNAVYATGVHEGILADAVRAFKYEGASQLADPLAARLMVLLALRPEQVDALVPVPLSSERLAERGYNQSELLANCLGSVCPIPIKPSLLRRVRHTEKQAKLSGAERDLNVKDAFAAGDAAGLSVLLIDDVVTTGSTLRACALALRISGATAVYAIAVSRSG